MDSRCRCRNHLIFTPADLGCVSVAVHQEGSCKTLCSGLIWRGGAAVQPSLPLTESTLHFQPPLQEHFLCSGGLIHLLFVYSATPPQPQIKAIAQRRRCIIVGFVSRNSLSVSWLLCYCDAADGGSVVVRRGEAKKSGKVLTWSHSTEVKTVTVRERKSFNIKLCIHAAELRTLRRHRIESSLLCKVKLDISTFVAAEGAPKC